MAGAGFFGDCPTVPAIHSPPVSVLSLTGMARDAGTIRLVLGVGRHVGEPRARKTASNNQGATPRLPVIAAATSRGLFVARIKISQVAV